MGERFMLYRLSEVDAGLQARRALSHAGREKKMRQEIADSVAALIDSQNTGSRDNDEAETTRLVAARDARCPSTLSRRTRQLQPRDRTRPGSESTHTLIVALSLMLGGLDSIGVPRETAWRVLTKVGLDSIPALRLDIMRTLHDYGRQLRHERPRPSCPPPSYYDPSRLRRPCRSRPARVRTPR